MFWPVHNQKMAPLISYLSNLLSIFQTFIRYLTLNPILLG